MNKIFCKRVYDHQGETDGFRILVDRLWPRGIRKDNSGIDLWAKEIAPSGELRKWYRHDPERYPEFRTRYIDELFSNPAAAEFSTTVKTKLASGNVTFLYAAKDNLHNNATVIKCWIEKDLEV